MNSLPPNAPSQFWNDGTGPFGLPCGVIPEFNAVTRQAQLIDRVAVALPVGLFYFGRQHDQ